SFSSSAQTKQKKKPHKLTQLRPSTLSLPQSPSIPLSFFPRPATIPKTPLLRPFHRGQGPGHTICTSTHYYIAATATLWQDHTMQPFSWPMLWSSSTFGSQDGSEGGFPLLSPPLFQ